MKYKNNDRLIILLDNTSDLNKIIILFTHY